MWKISCDFSFGHTSAFRECCLTDDLSDERGRSFVIWGRLCGCERLYKLKHSDFILSVMENVDARTWCCSGSRVPKSEIVYFCQVFLILCIVIVSIYNLTNQQGDQQLWVALLSSCMGYLLPNPSIKSWVISISLYPPTTQWGTIQRTLSHNLRAACPMSSISLETGKWDWWKSNTPITGLMYLSEKTAHFYTAVFCHQWSEWRPCQTVILYQSRLLSPYLRFIKWNSTKNEWISGWFGQCNPTRLWRNHSQNFCVIFQTLLYEFADAYSENAWFDTW